MTKKTFLYGLRRGLGGPIIELQSNPNRLQYKDIVLRCCLKDIAYDTQVEGTKGYYLYTAICALGTKDEFEDILIDAFMKRIEHRLFKQLADIICLYADDGSEKARDALRVKYEDLAQRLSRQRVFSHKFCERKQFEHLMICEVDAHKWSGFKKCIADAGRIILKRKDDVCNSYDWFLCRCENIFSKERIARYFDKASLSSEEVKAFVDATVRLRKIYEDNMSLRKKMEIGLENYVARARELEKSSYAYMSIYGIARWFFKQASQDDLLKLVCIIESEQSDEVRANLLHVFRLIDFPVDIGMLVKYAKSDCHRLQKAAVNALGRFKDRRVRDLAVEFMDAGNLDAGLDLMTNNWSKRDEPFIRRHVLSSKKVSHSMQMSLRDIYDKHRSSSCGDILEHVYRNGYCTFCRFGIVEAMWRSRVLKQSVLNECLYDSYYDTRKLAKRIKNKSNLF